MDRAELLGLNQFVEKDGIVIVESSTFQKANETLSEILIKYSDMKTSLFLSGGSTPKRLYEYFASKNLIKAGAVGLVDERYGKMGHRHSNELMIRATGLVDYFEEKNVRFYPILQNDESIEDTTVQYDEALRFIFEYFPKNVGILGIGEDGHTAGIPSGVQSSKLKVKSKGFEITKRILEDKSGLVDFYELEGYGERITMNFQALSMFDLILVLVLGKEKRKALKLMFDFGKVEEVPARFYLRPEIARKTILITDQVI